MNPINRPHGTPKAPSNLPSSLLVSFTNFANGNVPIYWGPEQDTFEAYQVPDPRLFKGNVGLKIPSVARFLFSAFDIDTDDYADEEPPPSPPPGPTREFVFDHADTLMTYPNGCKVYYVYYKGPYYQPADPNFTWDMAYPCYSKNGPDSCECRPECNCKLSCGIEYYGPNVVANLCSGFRTKPYGMGGYFYCDAQQCNAFL